MSVLEDERLCFFFSLNCGFTDAQNVSQDMEVLNDGKAGRIYIPFSAFFFGSGQYAMVLRRWVMVELLVMGRYSCEHEFVIGDNTASRSPKSPIFR